MEIALVADADEAGLRAWWEAGRVASLHDRVDPPWSAWPDFLAGVRAVDTRARCVRLAATDGGEVVGLSSVILLTHDNPHLSFVQPFVVPAARGRGVGSALVAAGERVVRDDGRTTILTEAYVRAGAPVAEHPFVSFGLRLGYAIADEEEIKAVDLATTDDRWPALEALAAERTDGYRLIWWTDPAPEEHVAELCTLLSRFLEEAPLGDMDIEAQQWTPQLLREVEERRRAVGRRHLLVAALAPDGAIAAYTDLEVNDGRPERAAIDSTLVLPEHRGHRLGLAMKVRLHQLTREVLPAVTRITTSNAAVNAHMNAVNEQLGYVVEETCVELQKVL